MTKTLFLFDSPTLSTSPYEEFFKPLDENIVERELNGLGNITIDKIYSSPYWSSIELSVKILEYFNTNGNQFMIENSLYDVLDKKKYEIHKSNYYLSQHYKEYVVVYGSNMRHNKNRNNHPNNNEKKNRNKTISKYVNTYYTSSKMISNIKYGEDEHDIINRIGPFLFKLLGSLDDGMHIALVTHKSLIDVIVGYVNRYKNQRSYDIVLKILTNE